MNLAKLGKLSTDPKAFRRQPISDNSSFKKTLIVDTAIYHAS